MAISTEMGEGARDEAKGRGGDPGDPKLQQPFPMMLEMCQWRTSRTQGKRKRQGAVRMNIRPRPRSTSFHPPNPPRIQLERPLLMKRSKFISTCAAPTRNQRAREADEFGVITFALGTRRGETPVRVWERKLVEELRVVWGSGCLRTMPWRIPRRRPGHGDQLVLGWGGLKTGSSVCRGQIRQILYRAASRSDITIHAIFFNYSSYQPKILCSSCTAIPF